MICNGSKSVTEINEKYNVVVNNEELIGTAEYMTLYTGSCII